jgi:RNA ligase (TIGR02306 family)
MAERKLASIQVVHDIQPIEGADFIEMVRVLGWQLVSKKGTFQKYDKCVYFEIDSILPDAEWNDITESGKRLTTRKFKGQISQGLALPLHLFNLGEVETGMDVTAQIGVRKWEPAEKFNQGQAKGNFPSHLGLKKTDETRVQSEPKVLQELWGKPFYISLKCDGTSCTCYVDPDTKEFEVASRNLRKKRPVEDQEPDVYWKAISNLKIEEKLNKNPQYTLQGEVVGESIQGNKMGLKGVTMLVFNIYNMETKQYLDFPEFQRVAKELDIPTVPILEVGDSFEYDLPTLLQKAKGKYDSGKQREGIVIRPQTNFWSRELSENLSFKVINDDFLLKEASE